MLITCNMLTKYEGHLPVGILGFGTFAY